MTLAHKLLLLVVAFYFLESTNGAIARLKIPANPKYPGKCFIAKGTEYVGNIRKNIIMSVGERRPAPNENCEELSCALIDDEFTVFMTTCSFPSTEQPDCRVVRNERLPYPKCCPKLQCDSPLTYPVSAVG